MRYFTCAQQSKNCRIIPAKIVKDFLNCFSKLMLENLCKKCIKIKKLRILGLDKSVNIFHCIFLNKNKKHFSGFRSENFFSSRFKWNSLDTSLSTENSLPTPILSTYTYTLHCNRVSRRRHAIILVIVTPSRGTYPSRVARVARQPSGN